MNAIRVGFIGLGNMGSVHLRSLRQGIVSALEVAAICDSDPTRLTMDPAIPSFTDPHALIHSGSVDAALIATPHYAHTSVGIDALEHGPARAGREADLRPQGGLRTAARRPRGQGKAGIRGDVQPAHRSVLPEASARSPERRAGRGAAGQLDRHATGSAREAYYASGGWRATWAGEGGGVLLNQCPHNLDLLQWIFGMPTSVRAFCTVRAVTTTSRSRTT